MENMPNYINKRNQEYKAMESNFGILVPEKRFITQLNKFFTKRMRAYCCNSSARRNKKDQTKRSNTIKYHRQGEAKGATN
jgi:hypothetical protein